MSSWIREHQTLLYWLAAATLPLIAATVVLVPAVLVRIPADYFAQERRPPSRWSGAHPLARLGLAIGRNVLGYLLLLSGIAMLVLPGQGLLTLVLGFLMLDFPGKYRFEKWLFSRRRIHDSINWLRRRSGREPLRVN